MKSKRIVCFVLAAMLVAGSIPAQSVRLTTPGGTVTTDVTLGTDASGQETPNPPEPEIFSVTVPTELPIQIDKEGNISTGRNLYITNSSTKDVKVTAISVEGKNGWSIANYNDNFSAKATNTKELGLSLRGDTTRAGGRITVTPENWVIGKDEDLDIEASAKLGKQTKAAKSDIAGINWTIDWADASTPETPEEPETPTETFTVDYENGLMLPGSYNIANFQWDSENRSTEFANITSSAPEVADVGQSAAMAIYRGEKPIEVVAKSRGTTVFTGTLNTGKTVSFTVNVYELDTSKKPTANIRGESDLEAGDTLAPESIDVLIPVVNPDGNTSDYLLHPETVPDGKLQPGNNLMSITVDANGVPIKVALNVSTANLSNGLVMSVQEAQDMGFTFAVYEEGLQITGFENKQFKANINVPETIGDFKVLKIGDNAFKGQSNLKTVTLPDSVVAIGDNAFNECTNLTNVNVSHNTASIGANAFRGSSKLDLSLVHVPSVSAGAFDSIKSLKILGGKDDFYPLSTKIASAIADAVSSGTAVSLFSDKGEDIVPISAIATKGTAHYICQAGTLAWADIPKDGNYSENLGDVYYPAYFNGKELGEREAPPVLDKISAPEGTRVHFAKKYDGITYPAEAWIDLPKPSYIASIYYSSYGFEGFVGMTDAQKKANALVFWHYLDADVMMGMDLTGYTLMSRTAPTIEYSNKTDQITITAPGAKSAWKSKVKVLSKCMSSRHSCGSLISLSDFAKSTAKSIGSPAKTISATKSAWNVSYHNANSHGNYPPAIKIVFWIKDNTNKMVSLPFTWSLSQDTITIGTYTETVCKD